MDGFVNYPHPVFIYKDQKMHLRNHAFHWGHPDF